METELEGTLLLLAIAIIALLIVQTVTLIVWLTTFRRWCLRTEAVMNQISRNLEPVLGAARELLAEGKERLTAVSANLNTLSSNLAEISNLTKSQLNRLDGILSEVSERARLQLVRLDQLVANTVGRIEEATETIQRNVLAPIREISALLAGVRTALDVLFRRHKSAVERATHDEELFI